MSFVVRRVSALFVLLFLASVMGCGADKSNSVSEPPPQMTPEEMEESLKRQKEHYSTPSNADRMQSSN